MKTREQLVPYVEMMRKLSAAYPNTAMAAESQVLYAEMLMDIPLDELEVVVRQCIVECKFLPTVSEIMERHRLLSGTIAIPTWEEAWELMQKAMRQVPYNEKPRFVSNPYLQRTVDIIGWRELRTSPEITTMRAQFRDVYRGLVERDGKLSALLPQAQRMVESKVGQLPWTQRLLESH